MAVATLDATVSGLTSNTYGTNAEAVLHLEIRPGGKAFIDLDSEQQNAALLYSTIMIDRETFWGQKTVAAQALKFPRAGDTVINLDVKHAQFEQALHLVDGGWLKQMEFLDLQSLGVREVAAEGTKVRNWPFTPDAFPAWRLAPQARNLLLRFLETGAILARA